MSQLPSWLPLGSPCSSLPLAGPSRASPGPGTINSMGPCVGVAAQGQEGTTTNANQFKSLIKHWYSIMQSSNCSMLMYISAHNIVKLTSKKVITIFSINYPLLFLLKYHLAPLLYWITANSNDEIN